jgi:hypothetical protein
MAFFPPFLSNEPGKGIKQKWDSIGGKREEKE